MQSGVRPIAIATLADRASAMGLEWVKLDNTAEPWQKPAPQKTGHPWAMLREWLARHITPGQTVAATLSVLNDFGDRTEVRRLIRHSVPGEGKAMAGKTGTKGGAGNTPPVDVNQLVGFVITRLGLTLDAILAEQKRQGERLDRVLELVREREETPEEEDGGGGDTLREVIGMVGGAGGNGGEKNVLGSLGDLGALASLLKGRAA